MSAAPSVSGLHAVILLAQGRTEGVAQLRSEPSDVARSFIAMAVAVPPIVALRFLNWENGTGVPADAARILTLDLLVYAVSWLAFAIISFRLADRLSVLVQGRVIATGNPDEIKSNPEVKKAYLGDEVQAEVNA